MNLFIEFGAKCVENEDCYSFYSKNYYCFNSKCKYKIKPFKFANVYGFIFLLLCTIINSFV